MVETDDSRKRSLSLLTHRELQDRITAVSERLREAEQELIKAHAEYDKNQAEREALYAERGQIAGDIEAFKAIDARIKALESELDTDWQNMEIRSQNQFELLREFAELHEHQMLLLGRTEPDSTS